LGPSLSQFRFHANPSFAGASLLCNLSFFLLFRALSGMLIGFCPFFPPSTTNGNAFRFSVPLYTPSNPFFPLGPYAILSLLNFFSPLKHAICIFPNGQAPHDFPEDPVPSYWGSSLLSFPSGFRHSQLLFFPVRVMVFLPFLRAKESALALWF